MKQFFILLIGLLSASLWAQTAVKTSIDSGGGVVVTPNFTVIHTIGEVVVAEKAGGTLQVSEGFISAELVTALGVEDYTAWNSVTMYPNPTTEYVNVRFTEAGNYALELYDLKGILLNNYHTDDTDQYQIQVSDIASGQYLLLVRDNEQKRFKTFKLIRE